LKTWIIIGAVLIAALISLRCYQQIGTDEALANIQAVRVQHETEQTIARTERTARREVLVDHAINRIRAGDMTPKESTELTADLLEASRKR
jgi:hypothetical protein